MGDGVEGQPWLWGGVGGGGAIINLSCLIPQMPLPRCNCSGVFRREERGRAKEEWRGEGRWGKAGEDPVRGSVEAKP